MINRCLLYIQFKIRNKNIVIKSSARARTSCLLTLMTMEFLKKALLSVSSGLIFNLELKKLSGKRRRKLKRGVVIFNLQQRRRTPSPFFLSFISPYLKGEGGSMVTQTTILQEGLNPCCPVQSASSFISFLIHFIKKSELELHLMRPLVN